MKNITKHNGKLEIIRRLTSSVNGNPRFEISVDGFTCVTGVDSMHGYEVQNLDGKQVSATIGTHYNKATLESIIGA